MENYRLWGIDYLAMIGFGIYVGYHIISIAN